MSKDVDRQLVFQTTKVRAPLKRDGCWIRGVTEPTGAEDKPGKPELPKKPSGLLPSAESSPVASPTKTTSNPCSPTKTTTSAPCSPTKTTSPTLTSGADELLVSPTRPTRPVRQNSYVLSATKKFESVASPVAPTFKKPPPRSGKSDASITGNADDEAVSIVTEAAVRHAAADTPAETKSSDLSGNAAQGAQSADTGTANSPEEPIGEQPAHLTEVAVETAGGGEGSAGESSTELMKDDQEISSTKPATEPPTVESTTEPDAAVPESSPQSEEPVTESAVLAEAGDGISEEPAGSQPVTAEPTADDLSAEPATENASDPATTAPVGQEVEESTGESTEICKHVEKPVMETASVEPAAGEPVAEAGAPGVELAMESTVENAESPEPVEEVVQESTGESSCELTDDPAVEVTQDPTLESVDAGPVVEPAAEPAVEAEIEAAVEPAVEQTVDAATLPAVEAERETSAVPSPVEVEKTADSVPGIRSKVEAPAEAVQESTIELEEALDAAKPSDEVVVVASPTVESLGPAVESAEPCSRESEPGQETDNAGSEMISQTAVQQEVPHLEPAPLHHTEDGTAICSFCDKPIDGAVKITINYPPIYCHPGCFKCGVCALALGDMMTSMFLHGLVIHCDGCFSKLL